MISARNLSFLRYFGGWLSWQGKFQLVQKQLEILIRLRIPLQFNDSSVYSWDRDIEHLNCLELFQNGSGCKTRSALTRHMFQRDVQAIGNKSNEDMRVNAHKQSGK